MVGTRSAPNKPNAAVGAILEKARQNSGLSLTTVSRALNIPIRHLTALERGDLSVFSAEVYARGSFTKYAKYLGLATPANSRAFQRILSDVRELVPLKIHRPRPWLLAALTPRWIIAGVLLTIAVIVGSYVAWQIESFVRLPALAWITPESSIAASAQVTISGQAAVDAQVQVNEQPTLLTDNGSFSTSLILHPGINTIQITATNAAGRTKTIRRDLLLPRE